jgi:F0F1-type ATP synthase assembly protein I
MKLLPTPRVPKTDDALGRGLDTGLTVALFLGVGYGLDRWLGTVPIFMIALTLLAAVGAFVSYKYRYDAQMAELERERLERAGADRVQTGGGE